MPSVPWGRLVAHCGSVGSWPFAPRSDALQGAKHRFASARQETPFADATRVRLLALIPYAAYATLPFERSVESLKTMEKRPMQTKKKTQKKHSLGLYLAL